MGYLDSRGLAHFWGKVKAFVEKSAVPGPMGLQGPDGSPIGTVISFLGKTPPAGYLACDGAVLAIEDYPALADFFQAQFGAANFFGGDGAATFALPDMRSLFLRGYHGGGQGLSGELGQRQEGTQFPWREVTRDSANFPNYGSTQVPANFDTRTARRSSGTWYANGFDSGYYISYSDYTARPVNMAVLYCIKAVESEGESFGGLPPGSVILWAGSEEDIPTGFALCDGQEGRPDLRDRFVLGAGADHPAGETGGEEAHELTAEEMPKHEHSGSSGYTSTFMFSTTSASSGRYSAGSATNQVTLKTGNSGGSQPHNNMPPYYALCYIIKL